MRPRTGRLRLALNIRIRGAGRLSSPAGPGLWHVVWLQRSVREWAMRQGWGGRPVRQEQAQGILVAALGVLAGQFGTEGLGGHLEGCSATRDDRFRFEERKSAVATATAACGPRAAVTTDETRSIISWWRRTD
jgi:hypothetical protein